MAHLRLVHPDLKKIVINHLSFQSDRFAGRPVYHPLVIGLLHQGSIVKTEEIKISFSGINQIIKDGLIIGYVVFARADFSDYLEIVDLEGRLMFSDLTQISFFFKDHKLYNLLKSKILG